MGVVFLFLSKLLKRRGRQLTLGVCKKLPAQLDFCNDRYLVTRGTYDAPFTCAKGLVITLTENLLKLALTYYFRKATLEIKHFLNKTVYKNISRETDGILYFTGRILPTQSIDNDLKLADVCTDLTAATFCVPLLDKHSPLCGYLQV